MFTRLLQAAGAAVWLPSLCAVCGDWGSQRLCDHCIERFAVVVPRCRRCALQVPVCGACLTDPPPFARTLAAVDYDHPWDGLITYFKFHAALDLPPARRAHAGRAARQRIGRADLVAAGPAQH